MNTFIALYLIDHLDVSAAVGGVGLAMFLGGGVIGTLLGGRISDRLGMIATIRVGSIVAIPRSSRCGYARSRGSRWRWPPSSA